MSVLKDFLREQGEKQRALAAAHSGERKEWAEAVDNLLHQMKEWIEEADQERLLEIKPVIHRRNEEEFGSYEVNGLSIILGPREVQIVPVARFALGPYSMGKSLGRVDMVSGEGKYLLYRMMDNTALSWTIMDDFGRHLRPLRREHFEEALKSLLE